MVGDHIDYISRDFFLVDRSMEKAQEFNSFLVEEDAAVVISQVSLGKKGTWRWDVQIHKVWISLES